MPQIGTQALQNKPIQVAQAEGEAPAAGETHATVGHSGGHGGHGGAHNPLAEHPAVYYSGVALIPFLVLLSIAIATTRGITKRTPSKKQALIERYVVWMNDFARGAIGPGGEKYAPLIGTIFAFVLFSNLMGVLPFFITRTEELQRPSILPAPTANLSMTLALSAVVFFVVQYAGIRENGVKGYFSHFAGPIPALAPLIFPIELIGALVKPLSLSMRLFGNIFGEETVIAVLVGLAVATLPAFLPIPFQFPMLLFGVFGSLVQAGVYTILTCAYINLAIGEHGDHHGEHDTHDHAHGEAVAAH
ncbi:MAG: hypothetical protein OHK0029_16610 [Armatimonadaceae bacterium]